MWYLVVCKLRDGASRTQNITVCVCLIDSLQPYSDFQSFYPFYLTEHSDVICRRLHVVGTTIVVLMAATHPSSAAAMIVAGTSSIAACVLVRVRTAAVGPRVCIPW